MYLPHALSLAARYSKSQLATKRALKLSSTAVFLELMQHTTWFQFEIGDLDNCLESLAVAKTACPDRDCFRYGQYCNTSACVWYERHNLLKCRENNMQCVAIFENFLLQTACTWQTRTATWDCFSSPRDHTTRHYASSVCLKSLVPSTETFLLTTLAKIS